VGGGGWAPPRQADCGWRAERSRTGPRLAGNRRPARRLAARVPPGRRKRPAHAISELERKQDRAPVPAGWDYAPAPEARDLVTLQERYGLFIGGELVEPRSGEYFPTLDPSTAQPLAEVAQAGAEDVALAVDAAREAHENGWSSLAPSERAKYLFRIARILQERSREFAVLESLDGGKPIRESRDVDLPLSAAHFFYYAGWADKLEYAFPNRKPGPLGVAGQIIPWNFPLLMLAWKVAPALATGNTVVLKPAETTPLTALLFSDVVRQADLPPGVVNIVTGDGSTGAHLVKADGVDKIAFTGSTEVGKAIQRELAGTDKRLTLELGGKAANIIFDDAALDQAVEGIVNGIYFNQGHVCCAGSRLLVQESIYEQVIRKLKRRLSTLRLGDPLDKNTDIGAINSKQQLEKIEQLVEAGTEEGAEIYQPPCRLPERGYWFAPTVFTNVAQSYRIAQEEIFGPVLSVLTFRTPDEAVEKANNTPYGLSAGVWTEKGSRILAMAQRLRAGVIWANTYNRFDPAAPFGGYKESGFGREGGLHGLEPYLDFDE
jgi:aldehyde dehydrogenase (NAD+)